MWTFEPAGMQRATSTPAIVGWIPDCRKSAQTAIPAMI
jgi:hypothetical protein